MTENNTEKKEYIAIGCTGIILKNPSIKIPTSHLCKISEYDPDSESEKQVVGWMTLTKAIENFGEEIYLSDFTDICPLCLDLNKNGKDIGSGKISLTTILDKYVDLVGEINLSRYHF